MLTPLRPPELSSETLHASCVAIKGRAVLIEGRSGEGKSDLALRLIDRGAVLVSDDQTICQRRDGVLHATPPATIAGKIEVRSVGISRGCPHPSHRRDRSARPRPRRAGAFSPD
jgi:serine kinase of HPr protein (carbohydrate metabolism regulator)